MIWCASAVLSNRLQAARVLEPGQPFHVLIPFLPLRQACSAWAEGAITIAHVAYPTQKYEHNRLEYIVLY